MQFVGTFWALVPPIIAITLALITKEAYSSLFIGVVIGALFACDFAPVATIDMIVNDGIIAAIADNAGIFLFLVLLGIIVALVNLAGGSAAFGRWAEKNIHTRVGAQRATFILGILILEHVMLATDRVPAERIGWVWKILAVLIRLIVLRWPVFDLSLIHI